MRGGLISATWIKADAKIDALSEAFDAVLSARLDLGTGSPLAVAFSGGGDSLALLRLTLVWAQRRDRPVLAFTVDHRLHPQSADWTQDAGAKARALGAGWRALVWEGKKPATGLPAAARLARHALLAEAAREAGARVILMGHTADDIAEGEVMRAADAPGLGRLREWSPSPVWPEGRGVFLLRPLLGVRRETLRDYLRDLGETWLDDPANEDPRFARVRARSILSAAHPRESGDPCLDGNLPISEGMRGERVAEVVFDNAGAFAPKSLSANVLAALLLCASGTSRPPRGPRLERLRAAITAGETATLCGCRVEVRGELIRVTRAPPRRGQSLPPPNPTDWVAARFAAACGLVQTEAEARAL